jgi:hypothetical protein
VEIVYVDVHAIIDNDSHESKALWSQAVIFRGIRARIPFDASEINPVKVRQGVETAANTGTT